MHRSLLLLNLLFSSAVFTLAAVQASEPPKRVFVFFTAESSTLDEDAAKVVRRVAQDARATPLVAVHVLGFAAPNTGTPASNRELAEARAQHVADGLVAAGVSPGRVLIESRGAVPFQQVPTESRRVEIVVGS